MHARSVTFEAFGPRPGVMVFVERDCAVKRGRVKRLEAHLFPDREPETFVIVQVHDEEGMSYEYRTTPDRCWSMATEACAAVFRDPEPELAS
jgi:hypothetical protein